METKKRTRNTATTRRRAATSDKPVVKRRRIAIPRAEILTSREYAESVPAFATEKAFQQSVINLAIMLGWRVFFTHRSKHSPPGEPDLRLVKGNRYVLMELKRHDGVVSDIQAEVGKELAACAAVEYYLLYDKHWKDGTVERILRD